MKNKLTKDQQFVIGKMKDGYELSWNLSTSANGYYRMNKTGELRSESVKGGTVNALVRKGLIKIVKRTWNESVFRLVAQNKTTPMSKYERYKKTYPDKTEEQIIESLANELTDKVATIHKLLAENDSILDGIKVITEEIDRRGKITITKGSVIDTTLKLILKNVGKK